MRNLLQDFRFGWRMLRRSPGNTAIAVLTLALGIGATTAIFSAVYAVVFQPFPFKDPDRVVVVGESWRQDREPSAASAGNYNDWRTQSSSFSQLALHQFASFNLSSGDTPERVLGARVTHNYFAVFGIAPQVGRTFTADEDAPGRDQVVVLSHRIWTRRFAASPSAVGRTIQMDGRPYTVVGVMPAVFDRLGATEDLWVPAALTPAQLASHDDHGFTAVGRLTSGVSFQQANAELAVIFQRVKARSSGHTGTDASQIRQGVVASYASTVEGDARQRLLVLFGAVVLVMLIACGNVAHLLLARGGVRAHEVAVRAALGASGRRIVQQFLTEALLLALLGGSLGIALAYVAVPVLLAISPEGVRRLDQTTVNSAVLLFAIGATLLSALVTGLAPAARAARTSIRSTLNEGGRAAARSHDVLRGTLVAAEVALAVALLAGAGLLVRSAIYLQHVDRGYDSRGVLTARVSLPTTGYEDPVRVARTFGDLVERLAASSGVEAAAVTSSAPMIPGANNNGLVPEGKVFDPNDFVLGRLGMITPDYFRTFHIPLRAGRTFTMDDRRGAPKVVILSETAAHQLFPGVNAIGKRVSCCEAGPDGLPTFKLVVGIVGDVRSDGPQANTRADFYLPIQQAPPAAWDWVQRTMTVVVRGSTGDPASMTSVIRAAVKQIDPAVPVHDVATMDTRLQTTLAEDRFNTVLMLLLGTVGLLLTAIGIYGVISCFVSQRRREMAIRLAIGAKSHDILLLVLRQGMQPVWVGLAAGLLTTAATTRVLTRYVHGVTPHDPLTLAGTVVLLVGVAVLANLIPARSATKVSPREHLLS